MHIQYIQVNISYTIDSSVDLINFNKFKTEKRGKVGNGEWGREDEIMKNACIMSEIFYIWKGIIKTILMQPNIIPVSELRLKVDYEQLKWSLRIQGLEVIEAPG